MSIWQRIKFGLARFMNGRYGADQLSRTTMFASMALLVVSFFTGWGLAWYLSLAGYVWVLFRMFSRNLEKRARENEAYLARTDKWRTSARQARARFRNRKQYKYFKCPKCRVRMRLSRGAGDKDITCRSCGNTFHMRA